MYFHTAVTHVTRLYKLLLNVGYITSTCWH